MICLSNSAVYLLTSAQLSMFAGLISSPVMLYMGQERKSSFIYHGFSEDPLSVYCSAHKTIDTCCAKKHIISFKREQRAFSYTEIHKQA